MDRVLEFINHPFVFELIKGFIALNFGVLIGIFYKDWQAERRARRAIEDDCSGCDTAEEQGQGE